MNFRFWEKRHSSHLETVNEQTIQWQGQPFKVPESIPSIFRSITLLSDMVSGLPIDAVDPLTGLRLDPTPAILIKPDPTRTRHEFLNQVMSSLLYRGNAYLYVPAVDRSGNAIAFMVIPPDEVTVTENPERTRVSYEWAQREISLVPGGNLVHVRLQGRPGSVVGLSPIGAARLVIEGFQNLEEYARDYFANSANPTGTLSTPSVIDKDEATRLRQQWNDSHRGTRDVAILSGGIEFKPLMFSPEDSQFIQTREWSASDVSRLFGIPAPLLGVSSGDSLTYATTESVVRWLLVTTLAPTYLERIEQSMTLMLPRTQEAAFDTRKLLRADTQARFSAHQTAIEAGFMTPNEVRELERLAALEGGDELSFTRRGDIEQGFGENAESGSADREETSL